MSPELVAEQLQAAIRVNCRQLTEKPVSPELVAEQLQAASDYHTSNLATLVHHVECKNLATGINSDGLRVGTEHQPCRELVSTPLHGVKHCVH